MNFQELKNLLNSSVRGSQFLLKKEKFSTPGIVNIFQAYIPGQQLAIQNANLTTTRDKITITGRTDLLSQKRLNANAEFYLKSNEPHLRLELDGFRQGWKFSDSFAKLKNSLVDNIPCQKPKFVISSNGVTPLPQNFNKQFGFEANSPDVENSVNKGLFFDAELNLSQDWNPLSAVLNSNNFKISGPLELKDDFVRFLLKGHRSAIKIGNFQMPVALQLISTFLTVTEQNGKKHLVPVSFAAVSAELEFKGKQKAFRIPLSTRWFAPEPTILTLQGHLKEVAKFDFSEISDLLGKGANSFLPDAMPSFSSVAVEDFRFDIVRTNASVISSQMAVSLEASWELIPGLVQLENIRAIFTLLEPMRPHKHNLSVDLYGGMKIGKTKFDLFASFPQQSFGGSLAADSSIDLKSLIQSFMPADFGLPTLNCDELVLTGDLPNQRYLLHVGLNSNWGIKFGSDFQFGISGLGVELEISRGQASGFIRGEMQLGNVDFTVTGEFGTELVFSAMIPQINLQEILQILLKKLNFPAELPSVNLTDVDLSFTPKSGHFSLEGKSQEIWQLPIGVNALAVRDLAFSVNRTTTESNKSVIVGAISGILNIGSASFTVSYNFPGDFVVTGDLPKLNLSALLQEMCGGELIRGLPVPPNVLSLELNDLKFSIAPQAKTLTLKADCDIGQAEILIKKIPRKGWGFSVGFQPSASWKFSSLAKELKVLDGLKLADTSLVLSSADDQNFQLKKKDSTVTVTRGLNFFAELNMSGLGVDELIGLKKLNVYAAISGRPQDMVLEAAIDGEFQLGDGVAFGDVRFRLKPSPTDFSLTLLGVVTATINDNQLRFVGGLQVKPRAALFQATMEGKWQDPFGFKGLAIIDVALELGISFPPPLPTIGIAGGLHVGDFKGAAAVKFDSAMPSRSMIAVEFNRLYLMDILKAFCSRTVVNAIPRELTTTVLDIGFENVKVYIAPQPTTIGELKFDAGFTVQGAMVFWGGLRAFAFLNVDYATGILVRADVDAIEIAGIFKLTGAGGRAKSSLLLDLRMGKNPMIDIQGAVQLLGLVSETRLQITNKGFYFKTTGKIFNLFESTIEASGSDLQNGGDFFVSVTMKNDLFAYLRKEATKIIKSAADEATRKLKDAQEDIDQAQAEVNRLNGEINRMRRVVKAERDRDAKRLQDARREVQRAQNKVNGLNNQIASMRRTIQKERDRDARNLRNARNEVSNAQRKVDGIQSEINRAKRRIKKLKGEISSWKRWYDNLDWWDKSWGWTKLSYETGWRGTEIGALYAEIGTLEAAKATANGILEVAKQTLRGMEAAAKKFPIDADPRIAGLFTALGSATAALEAAKGILRGLEMAAKKFPIDADPRIAALFTALGTATAGLQTAKVFLEGVKQTVGGMAQVSEFIVKVGLGGLIDIRSASFQAYLSAASAGRVSMSIELQFMGQARQRLMLNFNFKDPLSSAKDLARLLVPA